MKTRNIIILSVLLIGLTTIAEDQDFRTNRVKCLNADLITRQIDLKSRKESVEALLAKPLSGNDIDEKDKLVAEGRLKGAVADLIESAKAVGRIEQEIVEEQRETKPANGLESAGDPPRVAEAMQGRPATETPENQP